MAIDFSKRSYELELMDLPFERKEDLFENLKELEFINKLTGGPKLTFEFIKKLIGNRKDEVHIVDVGFGAGDMLVYLLENQDQLPCKIKLTGVDLLPEAKDYACTFHSELKNKVNFVVSDYRDYFKETQDIDIVVAGLFCHHLTDEQLIEFFSYIKLHSRIGGVINDLARAKIAYYFIKLATQIFSKSRFTKNDAPLSVLRGFKKSELNHLLGLAKVSRYDLKWKWAYRYLLNIYSNDKA